MIYSGVEANVEATFIHFDQAADCESAVLWSKFRSTCVLIGLGPGSWRKLLN